MPGKKEELPFSGTLSRRRFLVETGRGALLLGLSPLLAHCGGSGRTSDAAYDPTGAPSIFHFGVISDTHVVVGEQAPQNQVLTQTVEILNAFTPALDFVVATGDIVDYLPSDELRFYHRNYTALHRLLDLTSGLRMPLHLVLGNHDYYTGGLIVHHMTEFKQRREELFSDWVGMPGPYYALTHQGVKFCFLNTLQQDPAAGWDSDTVGCLGPEQADWLDGQLRDGLPAFLFHHHPLATETTTRAGWSILYPFEVPCAAGDFRKYRGSVYETYTDPIYQILGDRRDRIRADFFGHTHLFLRDELEGVPLFMTNAMQFAANSTYDGKPMRFHIVECESGTGNFTIYNAFMIRYWGQAGSVGASHDRPDATAA